MKHFELLLFTTDPALARQAAKAGVDIIVIDWENHGKKHRQQGADTQINQDTVDDLIRVRAATDARIIVRINGFGAGIGEEIEQVVAAGANEILLPMVTTVQEVQKTLELVRERCGVGILIETMAAVKIAAELGKLPLRRVYVGLNDLAIQRRTKNIFAPLTDGMLAEIRDNIHIPFGFGGLTLPELGLPIPCRLLIGEMARMRSNFCFLRRSFLADINGRCLEEEVPRIRAALIAAQNRTTAQVAVDRAALIDAVLKCDAPADG